jgi:hypothetical protein
MDDQPPAKRPKIAQNATPATYGTKYCHLETCTTNKELILGYIDDGNLWDHGLTFQTVFGQYFHYFTDFKMVTPDNTKRSFSCRLSTEGKKKYKTGRRGALFHVGETLSFNL